MRRDGQLLRQIAVAEDLDAVELAADELGAAERRLVDRLARLEDLEVADVDRLRDVRIVRPEAALREATLHRRLAALEVQLVDVALRASLLALLAMAGGLAEAGADAASDAALLGGRALGRLELGEDVGHDANAFFFAGAAAVSSTATR